MRQRRARALALCGRAGGDRDLAAGQHAHGHAFEWSQPGALDIIADADAEIAALRARLGLADGKRLITGKRQRAPVTLREVTARIDQRLSVTKCEADRVRHLFGLDHVAVAELGAVEPKLLRDAVEQPFHDKYRLRPAGAAYDRRRNTIGEHHRCVDTIGRHHVRAGHGRRGNVRRDDAPGQERAGIMHDTAAQAANPSVRIGRNGHAPMLVALLCRREEVLAPVLLPQDRTFELHRRGRDHGLLGVERRLGTEAAADERCDHADRLELASQQIRERGAA